ncbi:unnamed protein product [Aphanomyces euteiches]
MDNAIHVFDEDAYVRRSDRAPKKPVQKYENILEDEEIKKAIVNIEKASAAVAARAANGEQIEELPMKISSKSSKKRSRDDNGSGSNVVSLKIPKTVATVLSSYRPCFVCKEQISADCLSHCTLCVNFFHKLCLKDTTVDLECAACEKTRNAVNASKLLNNVARLGEFNHTTQKNVLSYRLTLLHRYMYPSKHPSRAKKAAPVTVKSTPSPKKSSKKAKKSPPKKKAKRDIESDMTPAQTAPLSPLATTSPMPTKQKAKAGKDDSSKKASPTSAKKTLVPTREIEVVEIDDGDDVKVEATIAAPEASPAIFVAPTQDVRPEVDEMPEVPDVGELEVDVASTPPPLQVGGSSSETSLIPNFGEDSTPNLGNEVDDEEPSPAVETESYESAWPTGMFGGNEVSYVLDDIVDKVVDISSR